MKRVSRSDGNWKVGKEEGGVRGSGVGMGESIKKRQNLTLLSYYCYDPPREQVIRFSGYIG